MGSVTRAVNRGREHLAKEGLSAIRLGGGRTALLADILADPAAAVDFLGKRHVARFGAGPGILVKLLDSGVRLPLQTHPDRDFARRHLHSDHGKTECWIILGTRRIAGRPAFLYYGFRAGATHAAFENAYRRQDVPAMESLLHRVEARPGDVHAIPANLIHAIGAGVFLAEIQEPSDHVFQFDRKGPCWNLNDFQTHMNLGDRRMLATIDYSTPGPAALRRWTRRFAPATDREGARSILPAGIREFFGCRHVTARRLSRQAGSFVVGIVISGRGAAAGEGGRIPLAPGDTFVIPRAARRIVYTAANPARPLRILEALPPATIMARVGS